ncbi:hypothetical protein GLYMA_15G049533v4 [Glycine max]|nr:hypothetical protein GLYMA_15G049533v4 [Glycine max]KAH1145635.1 hypothetical protein GYH30_041379 [Glycine max]
MFLGFFLMLCNKILQIPQSRRTWVEYVKSQRKQAVSA